MVALEEPANQDEMRAEEIDQEPISNEQANLFDSE